MIYEFDGIVSGDGECFCWEVDYATFHRITGKDPDPYDRAIDFDTGDYREDRYRLYDPLADVEEGEIYHVRIEIAKAGERP